jgi:YbgC/YbaW family acyl-CoA thioester hydrolase
MSDEQPASKKRARKAPGAKSAPKGPPRKQAKTGADPVAPAAPATPTGAPPTSLIRVPLSVRWRDLDAFNHGHNSKFLSYLEEARLRWMIQLPGEWIDDNVAPVVAAAHVNYRRPIAWPNEVVVELFVERLGGTSLTIGHRIVHADDASVLYADGNVVMVWIDKQRGQPSPLPDAVRKACQAQD